MTHITIKDDAPALQLCIIQPRLLAQLGPRFPASRSGIPVVHCRSGQVGHFKRHELVLVVKCLGRITRFTLPISKHCQAVLCTHGDLVTTARVFLVARVASTAHPYQRRKVVHVHLVHFDGLAFVLCNSALALFFFVLLVLHQPEDGFAQVIGDGTADRW